MADNRDSAPDADSRRRLYDDFIASLRSATPAYWDESDLIEIFDYATDINDDLGRIEVLNAAARLYPDSLDIAERKAFFYADLGDEERARTALHSIAENSVMKELLLLQLDKPEPSKARARLDSLLADPDEWDDEWLIRLADVARRLGCTDWLLENKEAICRHTPYPQTFVYELANIAQEDGDSPTAAAMAEELTLLEPFNAEFWEMLAGIQHNGLLDDEKALNSVDYALAINPDSPRALLLKADIFTLANRPMHEVEGLYECAVKLLPDDNDAAERYARALIINGYDDRAAAVLSDFLRRNPGWHTAMTLLLSVTDGACGPAIIKRFMEADPVISTPTDLHNDGIFLLRHSRYNAAALIFEYLDGSADAPDAGTLLLEALHRAGRYEEVYDRCRAIGLEKLDEVSFYFYVLACLYTRRTDTLCVDIATRLGNPLDSGPSTEAAAILERTALALILPSIGRALSGGETVDPATYDLFTSN